MDYSVHSVAVAAENHYAYRHKVILAVGHLFQEEGSEGVAAGECADVWVGRWLSVWAVELRACAIAGQDVEEFVLGGHFVAAY